MQIKISLKKGSFFRCAKYIKQKGCIQEIYFNQTKIY